MIQLASLCGLVGAFKFARAVLPYMGSPFTAPPNKYVIITGCTDGIGKQYAKYLNQRNIPLVLMGRNPTKLKALLQQLSINNKGQLHKIMQVDFSNNNLDESSFNVALSKLQLPQYSISGVINCSGAAFVSKYTQLSWQEIQTIKRVNTLSIQLLLRATTNKIMLQNCFLLNLSSYTAHYPLKYSSVYSATKAYMSNLLQCFAGQKKKIKVLSVQPWYVTTKMTGFRKGWDCVQSRDVVEGSLRVLGKKTKCAGTIQHELLHQFGYFLQMFYFPNIVEQNYQRFLKLKELKQKRNRKKPVQNGSSKQQKK